MANNIVGQHKMLANFLNTRPTLANTVRQHMLPNICWSCVCGFIVCKLNDDDVDATVIYVVRYAENNGKGYGPHFYCEMR